MKSKFFNTIEEERDSDAYRNYLEVREAVLEMIDNKPQDINSTPSGYWQEELAGFEYMFDASPLLVKNLRHHCYHLTGVRDYEYRNHHSHRASHFEYLLRRLQSQDNNGLGVPESAQLGGFGYRIDGKLYNNDTRRFYQSMIALDFIGGLDQFRQTNKRRIIAEIGAGWGGFAYQFKTLFPNTTFIIVDFPSTILFSGTYLKTLFPDSQTLFLTNRDMGTHEITPEDYDFIFAPHYMWEHLNFNPPNLIVNLASFQEMTTEQVDQYIKKAQKWQCPYIYSMNHDRNFSNPELKSVNETLKRYYTVQEIDVSGAKLKNLGLRNKYRELKKRAKKFLRQPEKNKKRYLYGSIK